jgi:hypothetical protein
MQRVPVQSLSPLAQIESVDACLRALLDSVSVRNGPGTLRLLPELAQLLETLANPSLERRVVAFLAGIPAVVELLQRVHALPTCFAVIGPAAVLPATGSKPPQPDISAHAELAIIDIRNVADCGAAAYEARRELGFREFRFWGGRTTRLPLLILQAAASSDGHAELAAGGSRLSVGLFTMPGPAPQRAGAPAGRLTLVTSLFKGKKYIPSFIENLALSSRFAETSLMIFDAAASREDLGVLAPYLAKHRNIKYLALAEDPGLYDIWNLGVHLSRSPYIGNANLDDRRHPLQLDALVTELDSAPEVMLTSTPVVPMTDFQADYGSYLPAAPHVYFSWMRGPYKIEEMFRTTDTGTVESHCIPHCMPVWRRELHDHCGYFCEPRYRSAADYELWLRGMASGLKFTVVDIPASYYYINPDSYMRVDATHTNVGQEMHDRYIAKRVPLSPPYMPDFDRLRGLVQFTVN